MAFEQIRQFRDLTLIPLCHDELLVIACDSLGGIGPKQHDMVKVPAEIVGQYTVRGPLMEVLAAGARPMAVINTLGVEMMPTGAAIVQGIRKELVLSRLPAEILVTGSTEENVKTCQTALGITVLGKASRSELRLGKSFAGDVVACLGKPLVGEEVLLGAPADTQLLFELLALPWLHEILPVGSKGIGHEARALAAGADLTLALALDLKLDLEKSAGPSTCLLVTLAEKQLSALQEVCNLPVFRLGSLSEH